MIELISPVFLQTISMFCSTSYLIIIITGQLKMQKCMENAIRANLLGWKMQEYSRIHTARSTAQQSSSHQQRSCAVLRNTVQYCAEKLR